MEELNNASKQGWDVYSIIDRPKPLANESCYVIVLKKTETVH